MTRISGRYLLKRLAVSVVVIWAMMTLLFVLLKAMPGDFTNLLTSNPELSEETLQAIRERYGLGEPLWKQYLKFLRNYATLEFGYSILQPEPVADIIFRRLPRTLALFVSAFLIQYTVGVLTGIQFGWKRGSRMDKSGFLAGLTLYSIPFFWLAWIILFVFAFEGFGVNWFPVARMMPAYTTTFGAFDLIFALLRHIALPLATLSIIGWGSSMLIMRTSMQEELDQGYIQTARAKGLAPTIVKYKHAARNALIPVITQALIAIVFFVDGSVIVETVFNWPGVGLLLVNAIRNRNFPVAMAAFFMLGVLIVVARLVTDIVYTYLDPRIKFGESQ